MTATRRTSGQIVYEAYYDDADDRVWEIESTGEKAHWERAADALEEALREPMVRVEIDVKGSPRLKNRGDE